MKASAWGIVRVNLSIMQRLYRDVVKLKLKVFLGFSPGKVVLFGIELSSHHKRNVLDKTSWIDMVTHHINERPNQPPNSLREHAE